MAKYLVKKNDVIDAEATADKVLAVLEAIEAELGDVLGTETTEKNEIVAKATIQVDPAKRKDLLAKLHFVRSAIMADTSGIARGREAIANLDDLQVVYLTVKATHHGMKSSMMYRWAASTYNKKYASSPEFEVSPQYVARYAKDRQWDSLPVPDVTTF